MFTEKDKLIILDIVKDQISNYLLKTPIKYYATSDSLRKKYNGVFIKLYVKNQLRGQSRIVRDDITLFNALKDISWKSCLNNGLTKEEINNVLPHVTILFNKEKISDITDVEIGKHGILLEKDNINIVFFPSEVKKEILDIISSYNNDVYKFESVVLK